jgi:hypothetical protein
MSQFSQLYKKLSEQELLTIIAESHKYEPEAVQTAKNELDSRKLTREEIQLAEAELFNRQAAKQQQAKQWNDNKALLNTSLYRILETLNPVDNGVISQEKIIHLTVVVFGGLAAYNLYHQRYAIWMMLTGEWGEWDVATFDYLIPITVFPVAVFLFWKKYKEGWLMLAGFLTYTTLVTIVLMLINWDNIYFEPTMMGDMFPGYSMGVFVMSFLFHASYLWLLCKPKLRSAFNVSRDAMLWMFVVVILATTWWMYMLFS